jgi:hypothetical protein
LFSMGYGSPAAALHMSTSFFCRNPLLSEDQERPSGRWMTAPQ